MPMKGPGSSGARAGAAVVAGATAALVAVVLAAGSATASPGSGDVPAPSKSGSPANVNPDKQPVTDPSRITPTPSVPLTENQAAQQARAWEAQDPGSRVACFAPDGTLIAMAQLDRVDPSRPLTAAERAQVCARAVPTNRP